MGTTKPKGGRPRKPDVERYPSGRIKPQSRSAARSGTSSEVRAPFTEDPRQTALQARMRHRLYRAAEAAIASGANPDRTWEAYRRMIDRPIEKESAISLMLFEGTIIGIWAARERRQEGSGLTGEQVHVCQIYRSVRARFRAAKGYPTGEPAAARYGAVGGGQDPLTDDEIRERTDRWQEVHGVVSHCGAIVLGQFHRAVVQNQRAPLRLVQIGADALVDANVC